MKCLSITNYKKLHHFFADEEFRENVKILRIKDNVLKSYRGSEENIKKYENKSYNKIKTDENIKITCYCHLNKDDKYYNNCTNNHRAYILDPYSCKNIKYLENREHVNSLELNNCKYITDVGNMTKLKKITLINEKTRRCNKCGYKYCDCVNYSPKINKIPNGIHLLKKLRCLIIVIIE